MKAKIVPGDGDPRHGTVNGYGNLGCRGDCECTEAWRIAHREYMNADPERLRRHREQEAQRREKRKNARVLTSTEQERC